MIPDLNSSFQENLIISLPQWINSKFLGIVAELQVADSPILLQKFLSIPLIHWIEGITGVITVILVKTSGILEIIHKTLDSSQKLLNSISKEKDLSQVRQVILQRLESEFNKKRVDTLYGLSKINLDFIEQPQQIGRHQLVLKSKNRPESLITNIRNLFLKTFNPSRELAIESERSISSIYHQKDIGGKLLILGNPGFGKTTELLNLAIELLDEALKDEKSPIPIKFELSEWKSNKSISEWIIFQLRKNYKIRPSISKKWLDNHQIIPLFDGLDDIGLSKGLPKQIECINSINLFLQETAYPYFVVCCRHEEYEECKNILKELNGAVCLKALTPEKIKKYLLKINQSSLWSEIQGKNSLKKLVETPLFLSFFVASYNKNSGAIKSEEDLIESYFSYKISGYNTSKVSPLKARQYLTWLAEKMEEDGITEFLIENIKVDHLKNEDQKINTE
jgi:DNA polymerase III delta prime subunit